MSELREVIGRVICDSNPTCPDAPCRSCRTQTDAVLRALGEAGRTYEQGVADGRAEYLAEVMIGRHEIEALSAQLAQAREALEDIEDNCEGWAEWRARTTLAALTAGSTEGKDGAA